MCEQTADQLSTGSCSRVFSSGNKLLTPPQPSTPHPPKLHYLPASQLRLLFAAIIALKCCRQKSKTRVQCKVVVILSFNYKMIFTRPACVGIDVPLLACELKCVWFPSGAISAMMLWSQYSANQVVLVLGTLGTTRLHPMIADEKYFFTKVYFSFILHNR